MKHSHKSCDHVLFFCEKCNEVECETCGQIWVLPTPLISPPLTGTGSAPFSTPPYTIYCHSGDGGSGGSGGIASC